MKSQAQLLLMILVVLAGVYGIDYSRSQMSFSQKAITGATTYDDYEFYGIGGETNAVISLVKGTNFISLPVTPADSKTESITSSIKGDYDSLWYYDGTEGKWFVYSLNAPLDLPTLEPGRGYYLRMKNPATLEVAGTPYEFQPISLDANRDYMIGAPFDSVKLKGVLGSCKLDNIKMSSVNTEMVTVHIPVNSDTALEPGKGYWIKSSESCKLEKLAPEAAADAQPSNTQNIGSFTANPAEIRKGEESTLAWTGIKNAEVCEIMADGKRSELPEKKHYITQTEMAAGKRTVTPEKTTAYNIRCYKVEASTLKTKDSETRTVTVKETTKEEKSPEGEKTASEATTELCQVKDGKVICTSGNPKKEYETLGECKSYCKSRTAAEKETGKEETKKEETDKKTVEEASKTSQEPCQVQNGKVICVSGNPKKEYERLGECRLYCKAGTAAEKETEKEKPSATSESTEPPVIKLFTANPKIISKGQTTTIQWELENAESCSIRYDNYGLTSLHLSKGNQRLPFGYKQFTPSKTTEYMLICAGGVDGTLEVSEKVTVIVEESKTDYALLCSLDTEKGVPVGFRTNKGEYCDENGKLASQKAGWKDCSNSFECSSNVCAVGKCVEEAALKKALAALE